MAYNYFRPNYRRNWHKYLAKSKYTAQISDFCHGVNEVFSLLGRHAALIGSYKPTFRDSLSVLGCLTLEDGTNRLSQKVKLSINAV